MAEMAKNNSNASTEVYIVVGKANTKHECVENYHVGIVLLDRSPNANLAGFSAYFFKGRGGRKYRIKEDVIFVEREAIEEINELFFYGRPNSKRLVVPELIGKVPLPLKQIKKAIKNQYKKKPCVFPDSSKIYVLAILHSLGLKVKFARRSKYPLEEIFNAYKALNLLDSKFRNEKVKAYIKQNKNGDLVNSYKNIPVEIEKAYKNSDDIKELASKFSMPFKKVSANSTDKVTGKKEKQETIDKTAAKGTSKLVNTVEAMDKEMKQLKHEMAMLLSKYSEVQQNNSALKQELADKEDDLAEYEGNVEFADFEKEGVEFPTIAHPGL